MRGASRAAFGEARDRLTRLVTDDPGVAATVGDELFAVTGLLDHEAALRRALADPTSARQARTGLVRDLFGERLSAATLDQLSGMVAARWSVPRDLADATEQLAVMATAAAAEGAGELDDVEDELFRFGRIVGAEPELHAALASPLLPEDHKRELLDALLTGKVTQASLRLITQVTLHPRGRSLEANLADYAGLVAAWRQRLIATVRVATALTDSQRERLTAALAAIYGHGIQLNVVLDPEVVGGVSVHIGDELIDGTVSSRLAELRQRLAA
jgi:F-type H+-transporting ATPase subunit delta